MFTKHATLRDSMRWRSFEKLRPILAQDIAIDPPWVDSVVHSVSSMFTSLSEQERGAIFAIVAINVPLEVSTNESDDWSQLWSFEFLLRFAKELNLPERKVSAYVPLILTRVPYQSVTCEQRTESVKPYLPLLQGCSVSLAKVYTHVLMYLVEESFMDGRGRVLLRNLSLSLNLSSSDGTWIENILLQYLVAQQEQIDKAKDKKKNKYRYVKIGAVALGAGAVLAVTGGLAAPAVAGALILMGYSAATAASVAGSMAMLFGGTGAGLAGYKMIKRTRGLSDFEFQSFDAKNRIAVVIMVSGWMEEDEDDKRTFGVIPDTMTLKERLSRYYYLYAPERLPEVKRESWNYRHDPEPLFAELRERYGKDPPDDTCLLPPLPQPDAESAEGYQRMITECFESIAQELEQGEAIAASSSLGTSTSANSGVGAADQRQKSSAFDFPRAVSLSGSTPTADATTDVVVAQISVGIESSEKLDTGVAEESAQKAAEDMGDESVAEGCAEEDTDEAGWEGQQAQSVESSQAALADWDAELARQASASDPMHLSDEFRYWHWRELSISPVYELTLLRWEKQLQKDLGKSILSLIKGLSSSAAQKALQYTMLSAILAAVALPVMLLLDVIDNLWVLAVERADQAGKELATALLERPHGKRPVTLVGYSMGCRVIFSCLKELAKRLELPDAPDELDGPDPTSSDAGPDAGAGPGAVGSPSESAEAWKQSESASTSSVASPGTAAAPSTATSKLLGHAGALKRGIFSLGGKIISPLNSTGKPASVDQTSATGDVASGSGSDSTSDNKAGKVSAVKMSARDLKGLIGDVVLLGAPLDLRDRNWSRIRALVSGRLINGYSRKDMVLAVIYRYQQIKIGVSGIAPVKVPGVENINLTHIVTQHIHYCSKMKEILEEINLSSSVPHSTSSFGVHEA